MLEFRRYYQMNRIQEVVTNLTTSIDPAPEAKKSVESSALKPNMDDQILLIVSTITFSSSDSSSLADFSAVWPYFDAWMTRPPIDSLDTFTCQ
jgi:hypothetical protein